VVKRFLKEAGGIDLYENVRVRWIRGESPVLHVYNGCVVPCVPERRRSLSKDGAVVAEQHFKLAKINTEEKLHALMARAGFRRKQRRRRRRRRLRGN